MVGAEHFQELLDTLPSALITLGPDQKVVYRNRTCETLVPTIEPGKDIWDCLEAVTNIEKIDRMLLRGERVIFRPGPDLMLLDWLLSPERMEDGSRILMAWDAGILDEIAQRRITFVVGASHELRSPLTALLGFAEILDLERSSLSQTQAEAAAIILENARHLSRLVDDILDLTRSSFGELRLDLGQVDIGPIVSSVVETLRPQIEAKGQILNARIEPDLPLIDADLHRVRQIVFNLLQNAHVHSPTDARIELTVGSDQDSVVMTVADDGEGLPFEDPEDAFGGFERGPTEINSRVPGSGIGLTITRLMVELHRGSISVESEPGAGTTFVIRLPLDREKARRAIYEAA